MNGEMDCGEKVHVPAKKVHLFAMFNLQTFLRIQRGSGVLTVPCRTVCGLY